MQTRVSDRRAARRHSFKTRLRVRIWKSGLPEWRAESDNLSEKGIFFVTDTPLLLGTVVEILFKMPEEISGEPTTEWLCTGHVVRVERLNSQRVEFGLGVQFDYYETLRAQSPQSG